MIGSPLTDFQARYAATRDLDDLSIGYPRCLSLAEQWQNFQDLVKRTDGVRTSRDETMRQLHGSIGSVLDIPSDVAREITFSGSTALEKTIAALVPVDRDTIVTVPGFDSINTFVERTSGRTPVYLELDSFETRSANTDRLLAAITPSVGAVVLVSPNNPSGMTLSPTEIDVVADACGAVDAVLIVDHCFLLINPSQVEAGHVFGLGTKCRWAGLWDSSKTVEMLGEKFGLIASSPDVSASIRRSLGEIQLDMPLGSLLILNAALSELVDGRGLIRLNSLIRQNYLVLAAACRAAGLKVNEPDAGSFALIEVAGGPEIDSDVLALRLIREYAMVVAPSRALYPPEWVPSRQFIRVSLARPAELVQKLCDALVRLLSTREARDVPLFPA